MKQGKRKRDTEENEEPESATKRKKAKGEEFEAAAKLEQVCEANDVKRFKRCQIMRSCCNLFQISRSGRVIKPKKFLYDEELEDLDSKIKYKSVPIAQPVMSSPQSGNSTPASESKKESPAKKPPPKGKRKFGQNCHLQNIRVNTKDFSAEPVKSPKSCSINRDMGRLMWAKTKCGQMVQIKLDYDRPAKFKVVFVARFGRSCLKFEMTSNAEVYVEQNRTTDLV